MKMTSWSDALRYKGVGGWLSLFIISICFSSLVVFSSLVTALGASGSFLESMFSVVFTVPILCYGLYAAFSLYRLRPNAVIISKRYLLGVMGYALITAALLFVGGLHSQADNREQRIQAWLSALRALVFVGVWHTYLSKSKRVRITWEQ